MVSPVRIRVPPLLKFLQKAEKEDTQDLIQGCLYTNGYTNASKCELSRSGEIVPEVDNRLYEERSSRKLSAKRFIKLVVKDNWPQLFTTVGSLGLAIGGAVLGLGGGGDEAGWPTYAGWPTLGVSVLLVLVGSVVSWLRAPGIASLKEDMATLRDSLDKTEEDYVELARRTKQDYFELFENQLSILANKNLGFADTERVSVYRHDGKAFIMLGRYSKDPEYNKRGRSIYPDDQGAIGEAWRNGEAIIDELPDPITDAEAYFKCLENEWNIDRSTAQRMRMKSRNYVAYALEDPKIYTRIAVIVFESVNRSPGRGCADHRCWVAH